MNLKIISAGAGMTMLVNNVYEEEYATGPAAQRDPRAVGPG